MCFLLLLLLLRRCCCCQGRHLPSWDRHLGGRRVWSRRPLLLLLLLRCLDSWGRCRSRLHRPL